MSKSKPRLRVVVPPGTTLEEGVRLCLPTATAVLYMGLNDRAQVVAVNDPESEINKADRSLSGVGLGPWKGRGAIFRQDGWSYAEYWFFTKRQHMFLRLSFQNDRPESLREASELLRFILATAAQRQTRS